MQQEREREKYFPYNNAKTKVVSSQYNTKNSEEFRDLGR